MNYRLPLLRLEAAPPPELLLPELPRLMLLPLFELPRFTRAGGVVLVGVRCWIVPRERLAGARLVGAERLTRGAFLEAGVRLTVP